MFNFFNDFYKIGYLSKEEVYEACKWGVISKDEYIKIVGEEYV